MKCPICGKELFTIKPDNASDTYLLTEVKSDGVSLGTGIKVKALGCTNCGAIQLYNPSLIGDVPHK